MTDIDLVAHQLKATGLWMSNLEVRPPREVRLTTNRDDIPQVADYLRDRFEARPELILAEDTRAALGGFTLRYVFELAKADVFVIVSAAVPADDKAFPS